LGYGRYGALNGAGYHGHTGSIHGGGYAPLHALGKREADPAVSYVHRSPQGARGYYYPPYAYYGYGRYFW